MDLKYNDLVEGYNEALHNTLRKFKPGPDFLDTWVPDEDHTRCLFGIFEAAEESNEETLSVSVDPQVLKSLDKEWIQKMTSTMGELKFDHNNLGATISLKFAKGGALEIHPLYKKSLEQFSERVTHEGKFFQIAPYQKLFESTIEGVTLSCLVNEANEIVGAKHSGATKAVRVILDQLCADIQGKPFQEASEHGVVKLEFKLRDKTAPRHKGGIIIPVNADPAFRLPQLLIRDVFSQFEKITGYEFKRNFFTEPVTPSFALLKTEEKIKRIQDALLDCCKELGLQQKDVEVVGIRPDVRAVIYFRQDSFKPPFGKALIRLERMLREKVEPAIEIVLESLEDKNKRKERRGESSVMDNVHKAAPFSTASEEIKGAL